MLEFLWNLLHILLLYSQNTEYHKLTSCIIAIFSVLSRFGGANIVIFFQNMKNISKNLLFYTSTVALTPSTPLRR